MIWISYTCDRSALPVDQWPLIQPPVGPGPATAGRKPWGDTEWVLARWVARM